MTPEVADAMRNSRTSLPRMVHAAAVMAFLYDLRDTHADVLRQALRNLTRDGQFNFEELNNG